MQSAGDKLLRTETGVYRHHQHVIDDIQNFTESFDGGGRVDDHACLTVVALDEMQGTVQVRASFLMDRYPVGAGGGEFRNVLIRVFDHQVAIERKIGDLAQRLDDRRAQREVGDEVSVHDVDMDHRSATRSG